MNRFSKVILVVSLLFCGVGFSSCHKYVDSGGLRSISKISTEIKLKDLYSLDLHEVLTLSAPEVKQENQDKPLSYSWEIDGKEVSTQKDLSFKCEENGVFEGRLKIYNEDGAYFQRFKLKVRYPYEDGLYILASKDNQSIISYYPENLEKKEFLLDIYKINNEKRTLGPTPKCIAFVNGSSSSSSPSFYVATGDVSKLHYLNSTTIKEELDPIQWGSHEITFLGVSSNTSGSLDAIIDGKYVSVSKSSIFAFLFTTHNRQKKQYPNYHLASDIVYQPNIVYPFREGQAIFFDNTGGRLLMDKTTEIFSGRFTGKTLLGMERIAETEIILALKDADNTLYYAILDPGYINSSSRAKREALFKGELEITSPNGLSEQSVIKGSPVKKRLYYSSANKIYQYFRTSFDGGNTTSELLFTYGDNETVADILVRDGANKIYVGTNSSSGDLPGNIYCYDINTNQLLWEKKNVTGEIKQLIYRE